MDYRYNKSNFMYSIQQEFSVKFSYSVYFSDSVFDIKNPLLANIFRNQNSQASKVFFVIDQGFSSKNPHILKDILNYADGHADALQLTSQPIVVPGGEELKNHMKYLYKLLEMFNDHKLCRHSYIVAVGGGALLDMVGFAAAICHRGIRLIRVPTTVLSQNDSGVGVKNSINYFSKKNFLGSFAPPFAVINDFSLLKTLDDTNWRAGISEAIKVALLKDADFFSYIENQAEALVSREPEPMKKLIERCAELHMQHIAGADPFEQGSSRPLDFGHWAAHKLEQISSCRIGHGDAVAAGLALDCTYAYLKGLLSFHDLTRILNLFDRLGFQIHYPEMVCKDGKNHSILGGLEEFREHLGGKLTIMLLKKIGQGLEVYDIDMIKMSEALNFNKTYNSYHEIL